jgi:hypothetical protein
MNCVATPIKISLGRVYNAGIFSFTGTRKNPLNMFRLRKLTPARSRISCGAGGGDGVANGIFPIFIRGWSALKLSLACRKDDFAEDLPEEGMRAKASGTG